MESGKFVNLNASQRMIPLGEASERILEISLTAPKRAQRKEAQRMNISLVLDRSGSMHGEKLENVKRAALHVLDLLRDGDQLSLVVFDDQVEVISPRVILDPTERKFLRRRIEQIRSGGSTNLSGGWLAGCLEVASGELEGTVNRTILLTDGLANVGVTDIEALTGQAAEIAARGVSTTTLGVGLGFNEHLLEAMANNGRGNFYFIESASAIPAIFAREMSELSALTAKDIELTLQLPEGWDCWIFGGWKVTREGNIWRLFVGSLVSEQTMNVYVRLKIPARQDQLTEKLSLMVRGKDEQDAIFEQKVEFAMQVTPTEIAAQEAVDSRVMEAFTSVEITDIANESLKLERAGHRGRAQEQLQKYIYENKASMSPDMIDDYNNMASRMGMGMAEDDRKQSHYRNYNQKRQRNTE